MIKQGSDVLVVGSTGFLGSHIVDACLRLGCHVKGITLRDHTAVLADSLSKTEHLYVDIRDKNQLKHNLDSYSFDYVINAGGYVDHTPYFKGGRNVIEQHFTGVLNLIDCLDLSRLKGFVQIGSSDEYGKAPAPQHEELHQVPICPYSFAKSATGQFIQMLHKMEGFPGAVVRLFLIYGARQNAQRFLPQIIKSCLKNEEFQTTKGEQLRDFCYIDDAVDGIIKAASIPQARGHVINIASGNPVSIRAMIEKITGIVGKGSPLLGARPYRKGENMELYADIGLAKKLLDWNPTTSLEDGLKKTIDYYRQFCGDPKCL